MLSIMGKAQDAKIAERQCYSRKQSSGCQGTHGPNGRRRRHRTDSDSLYRLSVGQPSDANGTTVLMVRSLHRDEFHRHGDIHVTSLCTDIFLRRIAGLKRDALMMSLSGAELSTLTEGRFRPCQALQNYDSAGSSTRVK